MYGRVDPKKPPALNAPAHEAMAGFEAPDRAAPADGAISRKHKELTAPAVALGGRAARPRGG